MKLGVLRSHTMAVINDIDSSHTLTSLIKDRRANDHSERYNARFGTSTVLGCVDPMRNAERSATDLSSLSTFTKSKRTSSVLIARAEKLRLAKEIAEKAIKHRRVFTILGPYSKVRRALRERGWVEKFYQLHCDDHLFNSPKANPLKVVKRRSVVVGDPEDEDNDGNDDDDGDNDDVDDDENFQIPPWEEEEGLYGMMSRVCRNTPPTFIFSLKPSNVNARFLHRDQIFNHFFRSGCITTKEGLTRNLRELPWYQNSTSSEFYPRCHVFYKDDERESFIEDYRLTACMAMIKIVVEKDDESEEMDDNADGINDENVAEFNTSDNQTQRSKKKKILPKIKYNSPRKTQGTESVPVRALDFAIKYCQQWLTKRYNEDLDNNNATTSSISNESWDQFIEWYYQVAHYGASIERNDSRRQLCDSLYRQLSQLHPQFHIDGSQNVWIIKPGAKSRGRGIFCVRKLDDVLKMVTKSNHIQALTSRYVIQKYIERPLLIHNTKFDIRQWFLVTDWNPLTVWWYKECYVRFCSQIFTLEDFNESVHLSNNSIQNKYENCPNRSSSIPNYNMWDCTEFKKWLSQNGQPDVYEDVIYPGMKNSVINALLCTQDIIDPRKNCFELFGADFMICNNYQSWLIEINSSPCMASSTPVTARMTQEVLVDTIKVVVDRRNNRAADTGKFEICYQARSIPAPIYQGIDLTVNGSPVRRPLNYLGNTNVVITGGDNAVKCEEANLTKASLVKIDEQTPSSLQMQQRKSGQSAHAAQAQKVTQDTQEKLLLQEKQQQLRELKEVQPSTTKPSKQATFTSRQTKLVIVTESTAKNDVGSEKENETINDAAVVSDNTKKSNTEEKVKLKTLLNTKVTVSSISVNKIYHAAPVYKSPAQIQIVDLSKNSPAQGVHLDFKPRNPTHQNRTNKSNLVKPLGFLSHGAHQEIHRHPNDRILLPNLARSETDIKIHRWLSASHQRFTSLSQNLVHPVTQKSLCK